MRSTSRRLEAGAAMLAAFGGLAACGGGSQASAPRAQRGLRGSPVQILAATAAALDRLTSFHMQGTARDPHGLPITINGTFGVPGRLDLTLTDGGSAVTFRVVGRYGYLKANAQYWIANGAAASAVPVVANRWVQLRAASSPLFAQFRALTERATLGRCAVLSGVGTVTVASKTTTIDGIPVVVLDEAGNRPGSTPARLYVAAVGPSLPLRETQTGPQSPGATTDRACGETKASGPADSANRLSFDRFDWRVKIDAPTGAIDLTHLRAAVGARAPTPARATGEARSAERAQETEMVGTWLATGRVSQARNFAGEAPGTIFARVWRIQQVCSGHSCPLYITRTTGQGRVSAKLVWAGGHWTASFVETVGCVGGGSDTQYSDWTIDVRPSSISAVERGHTTASCGGSATNLLRWSAHRALRPAGSGPAA